MGCLSVLVSLFLGFVLAIGAGLGLLFDRAILRPCGGLRAYLTGLLRSLTGHDEVE